jgi:hypothetical protein
MAQVQHPSPEFHGRKVLPMRGKSWLEYMTGSRDYVHAENAVHGWEREPLFLSLGLPYAR